MPSQSSLSTTNPASQEHAINAIACKNQLSLYSSFFSLFEYKPEGLKYCPFCVLLCSLKQKAHEKEKALHKPNTKAV
jgi:hypothetical protein